MFFKEALRKYFPRGSRKASNVDDPSVDSEKPGELPEPATDAPVTQKRRRIPIPSLGELAAFAVGSQIEHLEEVQEQEEIYSCVPGHWRRYLKSPPSYRLM